MSAVQNWIVCILLAFVGWVLIDVAAENESEFVQDAIYMIAVGCFVAMWEVTKLRNK